MSKHESNRSSSGRQKIRKVIKAGNKKLPSRRGWWVSSQAEPDYNEALEEGNAVSTDDEAYAGIEAGNRDFDREQKEYGNALANRDYYQSIGNNATRGTARSRRTARRLGQSYDKQFSDKFDRVQQRHHDEIEGNGGRPYDKYLDEWGADPGYDYATETRGQQSMIDYIQDNIQRSHKIDAIMGMGYANKNGYQVTTGPHEGQINFPYNDGGHKGIAKHFDKWWQHPAIAYDQWHGTDDGDGYMEPSDEDDREQVEEWDKKRRY